LKEEEAVQIFELEKGQIVREYDEYGETEVHNEYLRTCFESLVQ